MSLMPCQNPINQFYNDVLHEIIHNEELEDYMRDFYHESWKEPDFSYKSVENITWFLKSDTEKKRILDTELSDYFK